MRTLKLNNIRRWGLQQQDKDSQGTEEPALHTDLVWPWRFCNPWWHSHSSGLRTVSGLIPIPSHCPGVCFYAVSGHAWNAQINILTPIKVRKGNKLLESKDSSTPLSLRGLCVMPQSLQRRNVKTANTSRNWRANCEWGTILPCREEAEK